MAFLINIEDKIQIQPLMNGAHLHLLLNHIPVLGSIFAFCVLLAGFILKDRSVIKTGLITIIVAAAFSIPVFLSGEEAEHIVEGRLGVSEVAIEEHEDAAEFAYWAILFCGAIALGTLLSSQKNKPVSKIMLWLNLFVLLLVIGLMVRTGLTGGEIRHPEIHSNGIEQHDD